MQRFRHILATPILIVMILFTFPSLSLAGTDLTLEEAIDIALKRNLSVQSARMESRRAEGYGITARSALMPAFSIGGEYSREDKEYAKAGREDSWRSSLSITQSLYTGGRATALKKQAEINFRRADAGIEEAENSLVHDVYRHFYNVLLQRENVAVAEDAVNRSQLHLKEVLNREAVGLANHFEVIRAEQQLSTNRTLLISSKNGEESARLSLLNLIGLSPDSELFVKGRLREKSCEGSRKESRESALANRSDLKELIEKAHFQRLQVTIEKSAMKPRVSLNASISYNDPQKDSTGEADDTWRAAVDVEVPVFDRNLTRGKVISARTTLEQDRLALEQKKQDILTEVEQVWLDIESSAESIRSTRKNLELARESLRLAEVGYREGVSRQLDVLDAQASLTEARKKYAQAVFDHNMNVIRMRRAEGVLVSQTDGGC